MSDASVNTLKPPPFVQINNVTKRFSAKGPVALDSVSGCIETGKVTGLVGPDGAGKTTLIRLLTGLSRPSLGDVLTPHSTTCTICLAICRSALASTRT